jgi:hypothetical protein
MQEPFPVMTHFLSSDEMAFRIPDTFLNGSAPCLKCLVLKGISFPSLPRLLLSASDLTYLRLVKIPDTGYISPEAMATCPSTLTKLEHLGIDFRILTPDPKRKDPQLPPSTGIVLSALIELEFQGVSEYLEFLTARFDAPRLRAVEITFFNQLVFDIPQISRFVGHLELPKSYGLFLDFSSRCFTRIYCSRQRRS